MKQLINNNTINYGLYNEPVERINYEDYILKTPMGMVIPDIIKQLFSNHFIFVGISGTEIMAGIAVVDLKYISNAFFYIYEIDTNKIFETKKISLPFNAKIEQEPDSMNCFFNSNSINVIMNSGDISVETNNSKIKLNLSLSKASPLRICTRAGYRGWVYTQKTSGIELTGKLEYNNKIIDLSSPNYMALVDWTGGYMRNETFWNWAAITSRLSDNRSIGLNLSCGVNETSFTENAFWIDNKLTKVDTVNFYYDKDDLYKKWHISSNDKKVDIEFTPSGHREEKVNAFLLATDFTQLFGTYSGKLITDDDEEIQIKNIYGWAEDHYAKW